MNSVFMKKLIALFVFCAIGTAIFAQAEIPPYQQYKTVPSVKLILQDSTGWELKAKLDKTKPLMLVVFSPECDHCQQETEELLANIDKFKHVQIVMATPLPLDKMRDFIATYQLNNYPSITVGRDYAFILPTFFGLKNLPFHAFYNKKKELIGGFEGMMSVETMLRVFPKK